MSSINNLSATQLRRAASLKERIEKLQSKLDGLLGSATSTTTKTPTASATPAPKKRRRMSAEGRARIAAAARARWAKVRAAKK